MQPLISASATASSSSSARWFVYGGGAVLALIVALSVAYLTAAPAANATKDKRKKSHPIKGAEAIREEVRLTGLANIGNTCFINCVLQSLASLDDFTSYLQALRDYIHTAGGLVQPASAMPARSSSMLGSRASLGVSEFSPLSLIEDMIDCLNGSVKNPRRLYDSLVSEAARFKGRDQHDAHELFVTLLDLLQARGAMMSENVQLVQNSLDSDWVGVSKYWECQSITLPSPRHSDEQIEGEVQRHDQHILAAVETESNEELAVPKANDTDGGEPHEVDTPTSSQMTKLNGVTAHATNGDSASSAFSLFLFSTPIKLTLPPLDPFTGLTANFLTCFTCSHTSAIRHTAFNTITVPVPHHTVMPVTSIERCLLQYTSRELVNDVICPLCSARATRDACQALIASTEKRLTAKKKRSLTAQLAVMQQRVRDLESGINNEPPPPPPSTDASKSIIPPLTMRRSMVKRIMFARCPPLLCLHINRLSAIDKIHTVVQYQQHLDFRPYRAEISEYCARHGHQQQQQSENIAAMLSNHHHDSVYELCSVVVHYGGSGAGHFVAYRKHKRYSDLGTRSDSVSVSANEDAWSQLSDESVTPSSWSTISSPSTQSQSYLLFYRLKQSGARGSDSAAVSAVSP